MDADASLLCVGIKGDSGTPPLPKPFIFSHSIMGDIVIQHSPSGWMDILSSQMSCHKTTQYFFCGF